KSGSWYSFGETRLGQGKEKAVEFLGQNPDLLADIRERVMSELQRGGRAPGPGASSEDGEA
ncbi:MAG: DNA recombination/repair protein RecA, partial [Deinococcales bacterium]